jgi:hypothetical protein
MKTRLVLSASLLLVLLLGSFGTAFAAPAAQEETPEAPLEGSVVSITPETDTTTGETTVVVVLLLADGVTNETVRISADYAASLGLVTIDETAGLIVNDGALGTQISVDPLLVIPDEGETTEPTHPV